MLNDIGQLPLGMVVITSLSAKGVYLAMLDLTPGQYDHEDDEIGPCRGQPAELSNR